MPPAELYIKLASYFESSALRTVVKRAGIAEEVLGREVAAAATAEDWVVLARRLSSKEGLDAGLLLEERLNQLTREMPEIAERMSAARFSLEELDAVIHKMALKEIKLPVTKAPAAPAPTTSTREKFLKGGDEPLSPENIKKVTSAEVAAAAEGVASAQEGKAVVEELYRKLSPGEVEEYARYLASEFEAKGGVEEIYKRLKDNRTTMQQIVDRANGIKAGTPGQKVHQAVLEAIAAGLADRQVANPDFLVTMGVMVATEVVMTLSTEYKKRGAVAFWGSESDIVLADLITFTLSEIVLTWVTHGRATSVITRKTAAPKASTVLDSGFTARQRLSAFNEQALLLGGTGFAMGVVGNGAIEMNQYLKERDKEGAPSVGKRISRVIWNAFLVGAYMATSSNIRYQFVSRTSYVLKNKMRLNRLALGSVMVPLALMNTAAGNMMYLWYADLSNGALREMAKKFGFEFP